MSIKVYIASAYTVGDQLENVNVQLDMASLLMDIGFVPFVPLYSHYQHMRTPRPYEDWMKLDLAWLDSCDCLLRLTGESSGADTEVAYAESIGIPVFYELNELTAYYTINTPEITITEAQYSELKKLYYSDNIAIKYAFPILVIPGPLQNGLVRVNWINNSPEYILKKLPWLRKLQTPE